MVGMRSEIARARMKHKGILIQYRNPFDLCIMVVVLLGLLSVFICLCMRLFYFYLCRDQFEKIRAFISPAFFKKSQNSFFTWEIVSNARLCFFNLYSRNVH